MVTKPDTVLVGATGARKKWMDIFEGRKHRLSHGYYAVRLPLDEERSRGISRQELARIADQYFTANTPWKDLRASGHLGVDALVKDISRLLLQKIYEA